MLFMNIALYLFILLFRSKIFKCSELIARDTVNKDIPLLPPTVEGSQVRQLVLGETMKMDELGPIIINSDGTTRRIANWDTLSPQEQASSWRLISARNKKRIQKLQDAQAPVVEDSTAEDTGGDL